MINFLIILMLNISPAKQPEQLFVASDSSFNNYAYQVYYQLINHLKPKP
jgi:hypothetical protein